MDHIGFDLGKVNSQLCIITATGFVAFDESEGFGRMRGTRRWFAGVRTVNSEADCLRQPIQGPDQIRPFRFLGVCSMKNDAERLLAKRFDYLRALKDAIRRLHGCESEYLESVPVTETFQGEMVGHVDVEVFAIHGHRSATHAYAWSLWRSSTRM